MFSSLFRRMKLFTINKIASDSTPNNNPLVFLHNNLLFLRPNSEIAPSSLISSDLSLEKLKKLNQDSYAVSYLINSCGLSPEVATSAAEKLKFETPERPDSVLNLLRTHGFTETHISKLVRQRPLLLLANPEKTLLPKLDFFQSIGISRTDLAKTICLDSNLLSRSLENHIIPAYEFLKSVFQSDEKVVSAMKRIRWIFSVDHRDYLAPNIAVLRELEVPESSIVLLLTHYPEAIVQKQEQFREVVNEIKEIGFDPLNSAFVLALHTFSGKSNKSIRDRCYEAYKKWGWSEGDILSALRKDPQCMLLSEKKITEVMNFLVNKMGWHSKDIARCPVVMHHSLEKRIIPRCLVIQVLSSKGLVKKDLSLGTILVRSEKLFLERFVTKYKEQVPQLLSVYQGKMDILEL